MFIPVCTDSEIFL